MSGPLGSAQWMYASGAEVTQQSLKFNDDESQYLSWTPAAAGNRKTWTWSGWVKRGELGSANPLFAAYNGNADATLTYIVFNSNDNVEVVWWNASIKTNAVFRDTSAWYYITVSFDTTQATSSNRTKIYVNGVEQTLTGTYPTQNTDYGINNNIPHRVGNADFAYTFGTFDGYLSDINFIDGQALDASSFGQFTNGYWEKIDYAGTYGTNGFHLTFQDDVVSEGFNAVTYRGTGGSQSVSGLGLNPDLVWIKNRGGTNSHILQDSIRGAGKSLFSNATNAESGNSGDLIASFDSDGFSVNDTYLGGSGGGGTNGSGGSYVAWAWDAGSGSPVSNTDGSITSTVKANPSYGFSIVSYVGNGSTGQSVGTGLSSSDLVIIKNRSATASWHVLTGATTPAISGNTFSLDSGTNRLNLNLTNGYASYGMDAQTNANGNNYIAYCFHSVAGYSSIGSYSGTGAAGNSITGLGFKPAFLLIKRTDAANNWVMLDNTRDTNDALVEKNLYADTSGAEAVYTYEKASFDNDGFTLTNIGASMNASGGSYIYVAFGDQREAAFWKDVSGQGNHWTPNNLDYRDSLIDSPANNFAVLNPLFPSPDGAMTLSEGNLKAYDSSGNCQTAPTIACTGKSYFEFIDTDPNGSIAFSEDAGVGGTMYYNLPNALRIHYNGTYTVAGGVSITINSGSLFSWSTTDIVGVAYDADNHTLILTKNGGSAVNITINGLSGNSLTPQFANYASSSATAFLMNFGQDSTFSGLRSAGGNTDANGIGDFAYAPPSGYLALCTANLPTPTIIDGSTAFNTVTYTGDNASSRDIFVGHTTDLVWIKSRSSAYNHRLADTVRGATKHLYSSLTNAEGTDTTEVIGFNSDGFTVGSSLAVNGAPDAIVAWSWKAGGTAVSNTAGSITSQVSANVDAGFSIVSYTGTGVNATVGHGLNSAPELLIIKRTNSVSNWTVGHFPALGNGKYLKLNTTDSEITASNVWNSTSPTSTLVSIGTSSATNLSSGAYIMYCFADVEGFSKAGSYTGNGSTDGPFVYCGFRPALVMVKQTNTTGNWVIWDAERNTYNVMGRQLYPNLSSAEADAGTNPSFAILDFVSNGVKLRGSHSSMNTSGGTYIFLAFASTPFKFSPAR